MKTIIYFRNKEKLLKRAFSTQKKALEYVSKHEINDYYHNGWWVWNI